MLQPNDRRSHTANPNSNIQLCNRATLGQFGEMVWCQPGEEGSAWECVLKEAIMQSPIFKASAQRKFLKGGNPPLPKKNYFVALFMVRRETNQPNPRGRAKRLKMWMTRRALGNPGRFHQPSYLKAGHGEIRDWNVSSL